MSFIAACPAGPGIIGVFLGALLGGRSFTGISLGVASPERIIVAALSDQAGASPTTCTLTVGGVPIVMTPVSTHSHASVFAAVVPTGTVGDITCNSSSATLDCYGMYAIYNCLNPTPSNITNGTTGGSMNVPANSFVIAASAAGLAPWTGLTEDYRTFIIGNNYTSASKLYAAAQTPLVVGTSGGGNGFSMAAWTE